ncbi:unnamed protein product [Clavelina lepadiformis]|uniref:5'-(N(7)-methylguanosine 5'-triphospho)-[mRNA] hydrolase n=1 Tax=Clavelina lepadiformis TaxID=159417 RepID=A0ABP0EV10_CLALP
MMFSEMEKNVILRILRRHNSNISHMIDSAIQVEAYLYNSNAKTEEFIMEGTLFVYSSYVRPYYGFIILDPLQLKTLLEPMPYCCTELFDIRSQSFEYIRCPSMSNSKF